MLLKPFYGFASQEFQLIGFLCLLLLLEANNTNNNIRAKRYDYRELTHEPKPLSTEQIRFLASPQSDQSKLFESTLDAILIPRSPGSDGHKKVQKFIYDTLHALQWTVSADQFQTATPLGKRHFANIVATLHPNHCRRLVLACHYDSKLNREKTFLGATDSAVPCAMLLHVATLLDKYLKNSTSSGDLTLQLVFFDGEEALVTWSNEDSLYGSRHLANKWSRAPFPRDLRSTCNKTATDRELDRVELLVLLDLIGARSPKFYSQFPNTRPLFARLVTIESELNELGLLERKGNGKQSQYFSPRQSFSYIEDDHVPFLRRNVPVLHVIATPFPSVWHREEDNRENLDFATIRNLLKIVRVFVAEYLHLTVN